MNKIGHSFALPTLDGLYLSNIVFAEFPSKCELVFTDELQKTFTTLRVAGVAHLSYSRDIEDAPDDPFWLNYIDVVNDYSVILKTMGVLTKDDRLNVFSDTNSKVVVHHFVIEMAASRLELMIQNEGSISWVSGT